MEKRPLRERIILSVIPEEKLETCPDWMAKIIFATAIGIELYMIYILWEEM